MENTKTILITGDYAPINRIEKLSVEGKHDEIFGDFLSVIKNADFSVINLECPLTSVSSPITKTGPALKASPECIKSLAFAGIDLVTLANNHILDQGFIGLKDTLEICHQNKIATIGAGLSKKEASEVFYVNLGNTRVAFIAIAENEWSTIGYNNYGANPLNPVDNFYTIAEAKKNASIVIVIVHGGHEMYQLPSTRMQKTYRFFIDAGADFVIGHHPHCVSGYEYYKDKPIIYSLGNFVFDNGKFGSLWNSGMAVLITMIDHKATFELIPFNQNGEKAGLQLLKSKEKDDFVTMINELNCIIDANMLEEEFKRFCQSRKKIYQSQIEPYSSKYLLFLRNKKMFPSYWKKTKKLLLENIIRCESHRDALLQILRNENSHT